MSTYLVAYSLNDFSHKPSTLPNGTLFRTWARPNAIDQCDYAAELGPKVLKYYEELFGIKFPLPKVDQIAVPDFSAGAMELKLDDEVRFPDTGCTWIKFCGGR